MKCPNDGADLKEGEKCELCDFIAKRARAESIQSMYAFLSIDAFGNEGIIAATNGSAHTPLVGGDLKSLMGFAPLMRRMKKNSDVDVKLMKFTTREEMSF